MRLLTMVMYMAANASIPSESVRRNILWQEITSQCCSARVAGAGVLANIHSTGTTLKLVYRRLSDHQCAADSLPPVREF